MTVVDIALHLCIYSLTHIAAVIGLLLVAVVIVLTVEQQRLNVYFTATIVCFRVSTHGSSVRLTRRMCLIWLMAAAILVNLLFILPHDADEYVWYKLGSILYTYKVVHGISFAARHIERQAWNDETMSESFCESMETP